MTPTQQKELSYSTQQRESSLNIIIRHSHAEFCSVNVSVFLGDVLLAGGGLAAMPDLLRDSSVDLKIKCPVMKIYFG